MKITFRSLNATEYAAAIVTSYNYAPVNPKFTTEAPNLFSNYFNITSAGVNSYSGQVVVSLRNYPAVIIPKQTIVYTRSASDSSFVPLATSYDSTANTLTFTTSTFGDFAFGIPQPTTTVYSPVPISPTDSAIVNQNTPVTLSWGTCGIVQTYHLQVSTSASFSSPVVDNAGLSATSFTMSSVGKTTTYYWRVSNTNAAGTSSWSNPVSFTTAAPFIKLVSPNGGEQVHVGSAYIARWQSNITDTLNIELMNGNTPVLVIGDSVVFGTNAFLWQVPSTAQQGTNYKVMITSRSNTSLSGVSSAPFTLTSPVTGISVIDNVPTSYELSQNYPNPFNPSTTIRYQLPAEEFVTLKIYDITGREAATLVEGTMPPGSYTVRFDASRLASGMYFYRLLAGSQVITKKMVLLK